MLDLHRLRVFQSVVASGSIHAAATNLGYTPSAISQHVAALQRETGLTLVTRAGRGIEPTEAGRELAREIGGVLHRLGMLEATIAELRAGRSGTLSIAYIASVGAAWMPAVVRGLLHRFPGLRLDLALREEPSPDPGRRVDVRIVAARAGLVARSGIRAHHLLEDPYVAVLPRGHRRAGADAVDLADLAGERWIDSDPGGGWCRRTLVEACQAAGFSPTFQVEAHDYATALSFVDAGIGLAVLPRLGARNLPDGLVTVPVGSPTPSRSIYALVDAAVEGEPQVEAALGLLRGCAGGGESGPDGAEVS